MPHPATAPAPPQNLALFHNELFSTAAVGGDFVAASLVAVATFEALTSFAAAVSSELSRRLEKV